MPAGRQPGTLRLAEGETGMNEADLVMAIELGAKRAVARAASWSTIDFWPGDTGAENLLQVFIAEAIYTRARARKPAIFLELALGRMDEHAFGDDRRRVDIALRYRTSPNWMTVIEVKKHPGSYAADLAKICDVLNRIDSVRYAYLVTYFQKFESVTRRRKSLEDQMHVAAETIEAWPRDEHNKACRSLTARTLRVLEESEGRWRCGVMATRFTKD